MTSKIRFALRQLARTPGFTATALGTLALCLGANFAIFAVVDAILVRPLPFPQSDRLVVVFNGYPGAGVERAAASIPNYFDRREAIKAFASVSIQQDSAVVVGAAGSPNRVPTARVSPEFFTTLGVPLAMGRAFTDDQLKYGADEVAVLTDGFWRHHFAADPHVVGRTFLNDGLTITVIGVLPRDFRFLSSRAEFYRPASHAPEDRQPDHRHNNNWTMIARLAPGVTIAEAQAQIDAFNVHQVAEDPLANLIKGSGYHTTVRALHADYVSSIKPTLLLLQAGVLFLLLIGGVNLANLLLIRASGRTKEMAVRQALGASRRHVATEVIADTTVLAVGGGLLGMLLGWLGVQLLRSLGASELPLGRTIAFDPRLAAVSLAAAVVVGLVLAVPIIWYSLHANLASTLQTESRGGTTGRAAQRLRHVFIVAQIALAFVLLSGAGLLGLSLKRVLASPAGFHPENILTGQIALPWKNYKDDASRLAFVDRLLPAIRALPGIALVAINTNLPFAGNTNDSVITVEGHTPRPGETVRAHYQAGTMGDYLALMKIPLQRGRWLEDADSHRPERVCVVDQAVADFYWPGADPIGRRLAHDIVVNNDNAATVVGVVASVKQNDLAEPTGHGAVYFPFSAMNFGFFFVLVRTSLPPAALAPMIQKAVLQLDPELPIDDLRLMQARIDDSLIARRSPAVLAGVFAAAALLLAAVGTYGVLAYAVSHRRREIGVRMALGAMPQQILTQFLSLGGRLLLIGTILGILGTWVAGRAMRSVLFGVSGLPLGILAVTAGLMLAVVFLAMFLPSRRAARVNPIDALRAE
ncbi:MAG TPA: ABC transporter permease [Opitutaceae bacterium]|nr:ABC transporter permease [Opitutaceae bacterium]